MDLAASGNRQIPLNGHHIQINAATKIGISRGLNVARSTLRSADSVPYPRVREMDRCPAGPGHAILWV